MMEEGFLEGGKDTLSGIRHGASAAGTRQARASPGLTIPRYFTRRGEDVYATARYSSRTSVIRDSAGKEVFRRDDVEVPEGWSQVATDILAQKYLRRQGVPLLKANGEPAPRRARS